jgi:uncharacterized protein YfaT (DUF1175 family)
MAKVECFSIDGVECWFYSQDHRPPHFHARKHGQWHFRVWFLRKEAAMLERMPGPRKRISKQDRKTLQQMAANHRAELLQEWEHKVKHDD